MTFFRTVDQITGWIKSTEIYTKRGIHNNNENEKKLKRIKIGKYFYLQESRILRQNVKLLKMDVQVIPSATNTVTISQQIRKGRNLEELDERIAGFSCYTTVVFLVSSYTNITFLAPFFTPTVLHNPVIIIVLIGTVTNN